MHMGNYDAAVEDFRQALDHADSELSNSDRGALREELQKAEDKANAERIKTKNYYSILGVFCYSLNCFDQCPYSCCGTRATEKMYSARY